MTRKDYMEKRCTHREYYAQFITDEIKRAVLMCIGRDRILASTDEHFNDIPLHKWDGIVGFTDHPSEGPRFGHTYGCAKLLKEIGESGVSCSDMVCIMKEFARQIRDENSAVTC